MVCRYLQNYWTGRLFTLSAVSGQVSAKEKEEKSVPMICFKINVALERQVFYPPFLKGGKGGFYKPSKSP
jgi:hypothetical protein